MGYLGRAELGLLVVLLIKLNSLVFTISGKCQTYCALLLQRQLQSQLQNDTFSSVYYTICHCMHDAWVSGRYIINNRTTLAISPLFYDQITPRGPIINSDIFAFKFKITMYHTHSDELKRCVHKRDCFEKSETIGSWFKDRSRFEENNSRKAEG